MSSIKTLRQVIRAMILESTNIQGGRRKVWNPTDTEQDYLDRIKDKDLDGRLHNRAAAAILNPQRVKDDKWMSNIAARAHPVGVNRKAQTKFKYNIHNLRKKIWARTEVSNWQRLKIRQLWQDAVYSNAERSAFWSDPTKVHCVHGLQMLSSAKGEKKVKKSLESLENLITRNQSSNTAELSCVGLSEEQSHHLPGQMMAVEFLEREIVYASRTDSWTQFLSSADEATKEYFQVMKELESSNPTAAQKIYVASLVKFPSTTINPEHILFSAQDFNEYANGYAKEVIIRNYTMNPETVIIRVRRTLDKQIKNSIEEGVQSIARKHFGETATFEIQYF